MQMSLFHRLKLLRHSSMLLKPQYRMMNVIGNMISTLFYDQKLENDPETNIKSRLISSECSIIKFRGLVDAFWSTSATSRIFMVMSFRWGAWVVAFVWMLAESNHQA